VPYAEAKLVTCLRGEVFDGAVELLPRASAYSLLTPGLRGPLA
jgi:dTDP-4-dehydrorhamnose 3,5-epimerase-like enzyme